MIPEDEDESGDLREVIVANYRVIYSLVDDVVVIFTFHHDARALRNSRRRTN